MAPTDMENPEGVGLGAQQVAGTQPKVNQRLRLHCLDLALRVPGNTHHNDVVQAAREFEQYILGRPDEPPFKEVNYGTR